jgi:hypothetical protein
LSCSWRAGTCHSRGRAILGGQFLASNSWRAIPGAVKKRKRKEKAVQWADCHVFFDWVVGVIRYGSPALSDSEDKVIGRAIPEGRQFLADNSFRGVVFLYCIVLRFDSWQAIRERESINGDVRILLFAHPPLLPALLPALLRPPPPPASALLATAREASACACPKTTKYVSQNEGGVAVCE